VDGIATPYRGIKKAATAFLRKLLVRRFPLGWAMGTEYFIEGEGEQWKSVCVNLISGAWYNSKHPNIRGDSVVTLLARIFYDGDETKAACEVEAERDEFLAATPPPDAESWLKRDIKPPEALLGEVIVSTSRTLIGGPTGIGKSHLALAMAAGLATGQGFAHWKARRPVRTLYVDGEMPRDLVQSMLRDLKARMGGADLSNLLVLCWEDFEDLDPLNSTDGRDFILAKVEQWDPGVVFFDNRMSLTIGDMKDEEAWAATMALVKELSKASVAQVWLDHTGHDNGHIYGTKTKEWSLDNVILLSKVGQPGEIAFELKFDKARRKRPETFADFAKATFTLSGGQWTWTTDTAPAAEAKVKMSPMCRQFYLALMEAFIDTPGSTTQTAWYGKCVKFGLTEAIEPEDTYRERRSKRSNFRKYLCKLRELWLIGVDGETVNDLRKAAP
jgi:hypothetical protein